MAAAGGASPSGMMQLDLYWSFRSPYSYLATQRILNLVEEYDVEVTVRPVYPLAIRMPEIFERSNPLWVRYVLLDATRMAEMLGLPFAWPRPDPVVMNMETREISPDQPYIHRLTRLGVEAARRGRGLPFIGHVSALIWGGTDGWHRGDLLSRAAAHAGLDLAEMDEAVSRDPHGYDREIAANQSSLEAAGHWGVPTLVFEGEPFFGQDRIEACLWRMGQKGLRRR